jgi:diadenylate cyclase
MLNTIFADIANALKAFTLGDFLDILLVAFILYSFFRLIKDTKAYQMAIGLGIVLLLFLVSQWANLIVTQRIISSFITYLIIAVIILFQGELRRFLTSIGSRSFRTHLSFKSLIEKSEDILLAIEYLSTNKIGALIAFEKEVSLNSYAKRGTEIDAVLSKDLLVSLFYPNSPLHDGAVIIQENKIKAAGCLLPLPAAYKLGKHFRTRTRHLAALGLSQETDAAVIIVSEETGTISIATEGNLERELDKEQLKEYMLDYLK